MIGAVLALLFVASLEGSQALIVIPPQGAPLPERVEIEWLGPESSSLALGTLPVTGRAILPGAPPPGAESIRVVGPDVVSQPLALKDLQAGIRLSRAGKMRLTGIPPEVPTARVFLKLESSDLVFSRQLKTNGAAELSFAVPLGTYSGAIDLGPERAPIVIPSIAISVRSVTSQNIKASTGRPLTLQVMTKEEKKPLAGASIFGKPTAELPPVFWRALSARCGVSDPSGVLACGMVPLTLHTMNVIAPQRRRARVEIATPDPESDPKQPVRVTLAPFQDVAITLSLSRNYSPEIFKGLTAVLSRCDRPPCDQSKAVRLVLGSRRTVTFSRVEPGTYRTWLEGDVCRSSTSAVAVPDDSEASDRVEIALELQLWHISGVTRLANGVGVPARIWFGILPGNLQQMEAAGIVDSDSTGAYETLLLAPAGTWFSAHASSGKPASEGETPPPGVTLVAGNDRIVVDIEMSTSGGVVKLVDKETRDPISNCNVVFYHWGLSSGGVRTLKSDGSGVVHWLGISKGTYMVRATCDGYRPASTEKVELSAGSDETTLELEPSGGVRLRIHDENGDPLPGTLVFLEQSTFENVTFPFQIPAEQLGATDYNGEISIPARPRPGFYVVAAGYALLVARLAPCPVRTGCVEDVSLTRPVAFPGIRVRNAEGEPQSAAWLVFSKDGVPIPVSVQGELLRVNQVSPSQYLIIQEGFDTVHMLPALFGPGIYDVEYAKARQGAPPERIPLVRMVLPAAHRIELTLPPTQPIK